MHHTRLEPQVFFPFFSLTDYVYLDSYFDLKFLPLVHRFPPLQPSAPVFDTQPRLQSSTYHHATNIPRPVFDTQNPFFNLPPCMHPPLPTIANEGQCRPMSSQQWPLLDPSGKRVYDYLYTCFLIYSILETHVRSCMSLSFIFFISIFL